MYKLNVQKILLCTLILSVLIISLIPQGITYNGDVKDAKDILWWYDLYAPSFGSGATADIDNDGYLEIVFGTYFNDEHIYALNANNGTLLWKYCTGGCNDASPTIYDVDLDGELEVILPASSPYEVYCFDGATGEVEWSTSTGYPNCLDSPPAIADVDNDGKPEIILGSWYGYVFCLNGENGSICWQINLGIDSYIQAGPNILDVNNDGQLDVIVAQYLGDCRIYSLYGNNGSTMWYSALPNEEMYHGGSFADIDEDGKPEIVIGSYDKHIYVLNAEDGELAWEYTAPYYIASPTSIADLNNDNHLEIVFTSYNYLGVLSYTGELLWDYTTGGSMFRGASIADSNNDGVLDVIFGADDGVLRVVRGDNGTLLWSLDLEDHYDNTFNIDHAPLIEDFDKDGTLDIFIIGGYGISNPENGNHGRAYVIDAGIGTGPGWPMFRHDIHHSACFHYTLEDEDIIYVDDNAAPNWYDATHVKTIQEGINNASQGNSVYVYSGIYYETIIINKTLNITGQDRDTTIIDGGYGIHTMSVSAPSVHLSNVTILNGAYGLFITSDSNIITGNIIQSAIGIHLAGSEYDLIYDNYFNNTYDNYYDELGNSIWNISKTPGKNIIGGFYLGGNSWSDYTGDDTDGDGLGDTDIPYGPGDYLPLVPTDEILDMQQTIQDRGFPIRHALDGDWSAAQSFIPTIDTLTRAEIRLRKFGTPEFNFTVELRTDTPQGALLDILTFSPAEVPSSWTWFLLDFTDTPIIPDTQYFIVCPPSPSGVTTSFGYEWGYAFGNQYDDGSFWFTRDGGGLWRDLPTMYEFTFRIYGYS